VTGPVDDEATHADVVMSATGEDDMINRSFNGKQSEGKESDLNSTERTKTT
jgi:hypothetical protein